MQYTIAHLITEHITVNMSPETDNINKLSYLAITFQSVLLSIQDWNISYPNMKRKRNNASKNNLLTPRKQALFICTWL